MLGIIIILLISWLLLWKIKAPDALGLNPNKQRTLHLATGILLSAICCTVYHLASTTFSNNHWQLNKDFTFIIALNSCWWVLKSVLFEELVFRGALLYILSKKWGTFIACLVSAVSFGIYHWFSYNSFGNPVQMAIIFFMTGLFGYALAFAFVKLKSIYLPTSIHLGWNLFSIIVFSNGPLGQQLLVKVNNHKAEGIWSLIIFLFQVLAVPVFTILYVKKRVRS
ncbi:CPBP family intramembrane glutamic endopeptidase [Polluticaenibacter yanchengensis]|uniref:CPBP family intramembrane metalloprotease n=1 Tax=Polluticaenibacter yanchengensis TaxID=3014562 RepID=A0ABT4UH13_9BACT|nr:CPBP family intramembrane metalloprotease [Chitinophagaceae bacterium LY-5]